MLYSVVKSVFRVGVRVSSEPRLPRLIVSVQADADETARARGGPVVVHGHRGSVDARVG